RLEVSQCHDARLEGPQSGGAPASLASAAWPVGFRLRPGRLVSGSPKPGHDVPGIWATHQSSNSTLKPHSQLHRNHVAKPPASRASLSDSESSRHGQFTSGDLALESCLSN